MRCARAFRRMALLLVGFIGVHVGAVEPRILFVAGAPSHGPGEHRFPDGAKLLATALNEAGLGLRADVSLGWPDAAALAASQALVIYSDGIKDHVANGHLDELRQYLAQGKGLVVLHFALEPLPGSDSHYFLNALGGVFEENWSVNPVWTLKAPLLTEHEVTRGVQAFEIEDEWYYHLRFRNDITPLLRGRPPIETLGEDGPRSGNPAVRAELARGEPQTLAWVFEPPGRRAFGFTGGHFHRNWGEPNFRRLVLNGIIWTAGVTVPPGGVPSTVAPLPRYATIDEAIARGDLEDVKRHAAGNPQLLAPSTEPPLAPLHQAILRNRTAIAQWLVEHGADVNSPDRSQRTPLHLAVERGNLALVNFLLARHAQINERDRIGWTPLHHAAARNQLEIARALIDGGADLKKLSERGGTALHEAAASGSADMVRLLLERGVDPSVVSALGVTALDIAREFKNDAAIEILSSRTLAK